MMMTYIKADEPIIEENNLHYMPCQIGYDGKAKVSAYFEETEDFNQLKKASFRGRPLYGREIEIPKGYRGYVIKKPDSSVPSEGKVYRVQQSFRKINFWNLDRKPSENDTFLSAFDWIDVSEALHSHPQSRNNEKINITSQEE